MDEVHPARRLGRLTCIVWSVRRGVTFSSLVVAAVGVLAALAVADALRPEPSTRATPPLATTAPRQPRLPATNRPDLTPKQEIKRIGNSWGRLFAAADREACRYMGQPACERVVCERVGSRPIPSCTLPSSKFRRSFEDATVQAVVIRGHRAAARFSNGELVEFYGDGGTWSIYKLGGNAGREFFE